MDLIGHGSSGFQQICEVHASLDTSMNADIKAVHNNY